MIFRIIQFQDIKGQIDELKKLLKQYYSAIHEKEYVFDYALFPTTVSVVNLLGDRGTKTDQWLIRLRFVNEEQLKAYESCAERLQLYSDLQEHGLLTEAHEITVVDVLDDKNYLGDE